MEITNRAKIANRTDQRKVEDPAGIGDTDRLSSLPDELISHILCFLETKYAVGTAVLSRRWKDLWTGVSNLDFDNCLLFTTTAEEGDAFKLEEQRRRSEFCRFIDMVMSRHENLNSLRRFRLFSFDHQVSPDFWSRMQSAMSRSEPLEEIEVRLAPDTGMFGVPFCVHGWLNLKVLNLNWVKIETSTTSTQGSVILLPSLKILQLSEVEVMGCGRLNSLNRVISGCPALETLQVQRCYSERTGEEEDMLDIIVSLPSLKNLKIIGWYCEHSYPANPLHHMVIEAPRLEHLWLEDFAGSQLLGNIRSGSSSPVLQCLDSAHINIFTHDEDDQHRQIIIGFLTQISNAREIKLASPILDVLSGFSDMQLPLFPNLTSLAFEAGTSIRGLHGLLNSAASSLQSLVIRLDYGGIEAPVPADASMLECLLPSLEDIVIHFGGTIDEGEMKLVAYLFKATGAALKMVNIHANLGITDREDVVSLLKLAKETSSCESHFHFYYDADCKDAYLLHIQDPEDVPQDMNDGLEILYKCGV